MNIRGLRSILVIALLGCNPSGSHPPGPQDGQDPLPDGDGEPPVVESVRITPEEPFTDGEVRCAADVEGEANVAYAWRNATRDRALGSGATLRLDPDEIEPGETLRCIATAENRAGSDDGRDEVHPQCGFASAGSMSDVSLTMHLVFRPFITDELYPGYEGYPWDWDGNVPGWIFDLIDALQTILTFVNALAPSPQTLSAAEAIDAVDEILTLYQDYGSGLFASSVPPDPEVFPYGFADGDAYSIGYDDALTWTDTYKVSLNLDHLDLTGLDVLALDLEDGDLSFNDNMGDYLDQGGVPLLLTTQFIRDTGWCTSTYYNPESTAGDSADAYIPSSVLWVDITVEG